ncbi:hypothetical protein Bca4012_057427 [Brassica carinata]
MAFTISSSYSPLLTKKQAHRRFGRGGVELLLIEEQYNNCCVAGDIIAPNGVRVVLWKCKWKLNIKKSPCQILEFKGCKEERIVNRSEKLEKRNNPVKNLQVCRKEDKNGGKFHYESFVKQTSNSSNGAAS